MGHLLAAHPNEILAIDFTMLEASFSGQENVLVMTENDLVMSSAGISTRDQRAHSGSGSGCGVVL